MWPLVFLPFSACGTASAPELEACLRWVHPLGSSPLLYLPKAPLNGFDIGVDFSTGEKKTEL